MIKHTLPAVAKIIGRIPGDADFAGVVALTKTAKLIQAVVKDEAKKKFNLKNAWVLRGIRITPATKTKIEARVFTLDANIADQDKGGTRSGKEFLIPGKEFKKITGIDPKKKVIPKRFKRKLLLSKTSFPIKKDTGGRKKTKNRARPFEFTSKTGDRFIGVRRRSEANSIGIVYLRKERSIRLRGRKFFEKPADREYDKVFQREYDLAFDKFVKLK